MDSISFHKTFPITKIPGLSFGKLIQLVYLLGSSIYWQQALCPPSLAWVLSFCVWMQTGSDWCFKEDRSVWPTLLLYLQFASLSTAFGRSQLRPWTSPRSILDSSACSSVHTAFISAFFRSPVAANSAQRRANPCPKATSLILGKRWERAKPPWQMLGRGWCTS